MKKDMTDYINGMTENNLDTLEQIISLQYKKFMKFYKIVEPYSSSIEKVKYQFESPLSLDVFLILDSKKDAKELKRELESLMEKHDCNGSVEVNKKDIFISIIMDEEWR